MAETKEAQKLEVVGDIKTAKSKSTTPGTQGNSAPRGRGNYRGGKSRSRRKQEDDDPIDSRIVKIRRVSRMYKGGRRLRMSVLVVAGDKEGKVGMASGKGQDVPSAQTKAASKAKKSMIMVPLKGNTIPHEIEVKFKASRVLLKPAAPGTGIVAGGTVKMILELAGVQDALTKVMGSTNQINVAQATFEALKQLQSARL